MPENETICRMRILSEEYRDFIYEETRPDFLRGIAEEALCEQEIGFRYHALYIDKVFADPVTLGRFTYRSIPNCYSLIDTGALNQAGILAIQNYPTLELLGDGVMLGFIDTGIDYTNEIFRNIDGSTRIAGIWDQTVQEGAPPEGFLYGTEYTGEVIDEALRLENPFERVPSRDTNGHGTFVASVAAGGADVENRFLGAAPQSAIGVVKLKEAKQYLKDFYQIGGENPCYQENDIMLGLKYLEELARKNNMPLVFCISLGTNTGDHNGSSPLSVLLTWYAETANRAVVIGGGNEANMRHHYFGALEAGNDGETVEISVGEGVSGFMMELWTDIPNVFAISIISPGGERIPFVPIRQGNNLETSFVFERTTISLDYRVFVEKTDSELVFLRFRQPSQGIWRLVVEPVQLADGAFHIWLPMKEFLSGEVYFLRSNPDNTITEPGNSFRTMTVSYYNGTNNSIAIDSGRGYTRSGRIKPDFAAPGVDVTGLAGRGRFAGRTGSSIGAGIAAGAAALLFEWLYYQLGRDDIDSVQIKNMLILGTERKEGVSYPNREWGYGSMNLYRTFNELRTF